MPCLQDNLDHAIVFSWFSFFSVPLPPMRRQIWSYENTVYMTYPESVSPITSWIKYHTINILNQISVIHVLKERLFISATFTYGKGKTFVQNKIFNESINHPVQPGTLIVSEWLLLNAKWAIFSAIPWREQVTFQRDEDDVCFLLDQHAHFDYYSADSLQQQSAVCVSHHWDSLSWSRANQCLLLLLNSVSLDEKPQINFYNLWFYLTGTRTNDLPHSRSTP